MFLLCNLPMITATIVALQVIVTNATTIPGIMKCTELLASVLVVTVDRGELPFGCDVVK